MIKNYAQKSEAFATLDAMDARRVEFYNAADDKAGIVETINTCDCLIVLSESWRNYFASIGVEENKIRVLNNIVSPPTAVNRQHNDGKLHLLYMGEISNRKGAFDLLKGQIRDSWENATYTVPLNINEMSGEERCIGFDYLFAVQTESIASVSITLQDSQGNTIAHTPNIRMPYKQGHITTVKGDFLTPIKAGIYIDKEYEGEINVNLDKIIHH